MQQNLLKIFNLSSNVIDLLDKIFKPEDERISLINIKNHPWIK